jgi:hypothetical protein
VQTMHPKLHHIRHCIAIKMMVLFQHMTPFNIRIRALPSAISWSFSA